VKEYVAPERAGFVERTEKVTPLFNPFRGLTLIVLSVENPLSPEVILFDLESEKSGDGVTTLTLHVSDDAPLVTVTTLLPDELHVELKVLKLAPVAGLPAGLVAHENVPEPPEAEKLACCPVFTVWLAGTQSRELAVAVYVRL
jgi:hypothetical protein